MLLRYSLAHFPDYPALQRLLNASTGAQSLRLHRSESALQLGCAAAEVPELRAQLAHALDAVGLPFHCVAAEQREGEEEAFWALAPAVLTMIAPPGLALPGDLVATLAEADVTLLAMRRLSPTHVPEQGLAVECYIDGRGVDGALRARLSALAEHWGVDLTLLDSDSKRPRRRLVAFDMDSTLIECEVIDELARRAGVGDAVAAITARAMRGELDFVSSFRQRMSRLRGLPETVLEEIALSLPLMPGAKYLLRTLRAHGHHTVILSGGFDYFARRVQKTLGIHEVHANTLEIANGQLTGAVRGQIVDGERKLALLQEIAAREGFAMGDTVAVGDGANDLPMLGAAGVGLAIHAKPLVVERAPCAVNHNDLAALLYVLGVPRG